MNISRILMLVAVALTASLQATEIPKKERILVTLKNDPNQPHNIADVPGQTWCRELGLLPENATIWSSGRKEQPGNKSMPKGIDLVKSDRPFVIEVPFGTSDAVLAQVRKHHLVAEAIKDGIIHVGGNIGTSGGTPGVPWLSMLHIPEARKFVGKGNPNLIYAPLDSGAVTNAVITQERLLPAHNDTVGNENTTDDNGHGTAVISIFAMIDLSAKIMPEKVLDANGNGTYSAVINGIYNVIDAGAKIISISAGGAMTSVAMKTAIDYAISNKCIVISISGNDSTTNVWFPGSLPEIICCAAITASGIHWSSSNSGNSVDVAGLGENVATYGLDGNPIQVSGTSFVAPQVAAIVSFLLLMRPELTQADIEQILCASAVQNGDGSGFNQQLGFGQVNALNALQLITVSGYVTLDSGGMHAHWIGLPSNASVKKPFGKFYRSSDLKSKVWTMVPNQTMVTYGVSDGTATCTDLAPFQGQEFGRVVIDRASISQ